MKGFSDVFNRNVIFPNIEIMKELRLTKCKLSFIGRFGPNHSAFYLYMANSACFFSTPCHGHAWPLKGCGLCTVMSVPCNHAEKIAPLFLKFWVLSTFTIICSLTIIQKHYFLQMSCTKFYGKTRSGYLELWTVVTGRILISQLHISVSFTVKIVVSTEYKLYSGEYFERTTIWIQWFFPWKCVICKRSRNWQRRLSLGRLECGNTKILSVLVVNVFIFGLIFLATYIAAFQTLLE